MIPDFLRPFPIIGILRGVDPNRTVAAAQAATRGGVTVLEITMSSVEPLAQMEAVRKEVPAVTVGAGTVLSINDVQAAVNVGATFIVSPHFDEDIVRYCVEANIPVFPGAMTPTEIWSAHRAGATMVKLFPAATLGTEFLRSVRGPLPQVDLLVTGGVDASNVGSFMKVGAKGAAVGGHLFPKHLLASGDTRGIEEEARKLVAACRDALTV